MWSSVATLKISCVSFSKIVFHRRIVQKVLSLAAGFRKQNPRIYIYISIYIHVCVCVCVFVQMNWALGSR